MKRKYCDVLSTKSDNDRRKIKVTRRFLEGPGLMQDQIKRKQESIANLESMCCSITSHLSPGKSGTSGNRNIHAREDLIAKKLDLEKELCKDVQQLEDMKAEVVLCLMSLKDPNQQTAIRYRFLDGYSNQEAADKMFVDIRTVQRYIESGCLAMRLPDRYYKKKPAENDNRDGNSGEKHSAA